MSFLNYNISFLNDKNQFYNIKKIDYINLIV